jgi:hypothetical protein
MNTLQDTVLQAAESYVLARTETDMAIAAPRPRARGLLDYNRRNAMLMRGRIRVSEAFQTLQRAVTAWQERRAE